MQLTPKAKALNAALLAAAFRGRADQPVRRVARGDKLVAVAARAAGLASRPPTTGVPAADLPAQPELVDAPRSLKEVAALLLTSEGDAPAFGLAAVNALLPPPPDAEPRKAQELVARLGAGKRVAVVGHFPFVERLRPQCARLDVLELAPHPGDLPASQAPTVLPGADVVVITGSSIVGGTLAGLLELCPQRAFVLLAGPSAPFAPCLLDMGVSAIAGSVVDDEDAALADILAGRPYRELRGVRPLLWQPQKPTLLRNPA